MAKFYGINNEFVFDSKRDCLLCKFSNGELTTTNKYVIERLRELGYKEEVRPKAEVQAESKTKTKTNSKG